MKLIQPLLIACCLLMTISSVWADNQARVFYDKATNNKETLAKKELAKSGVAEEVVVFINEKFKLAQPLNFRFGGQDGPLFDSSINSVLIPYSFLDEVKLRFKRAKYSQSGVSVLDASLDSVMHTLFHELAHALIFMHDIPVLGKEEDAADGLANILLIEFFDEGAEIAISAADLFDLESEDIVEFEEADFWGEHSLDLQRYFSTLCYVYGSEPSKYATLIQDSGFSEQRAEHCISDYANSLRSWLVLLKPYTKNNVALAN